MKTIIALTFLGILTYAFAEMFKYGEGVCQQDKINGMTKFDTKKFFSGTWYLTHSTPSTRVTESTICRDYVIKTKDDGKIIVTYSYYENGGSDNLYEVTCTGTQNTTKIDIFNFDCNLKNARGENAKFYVDVLFPETDYDRFGIFYRCVTIGAHVEDNVFLIFRDKNPSEDEVKKLIDRYGLTNLISRKDATCTN